MSPNFRRGPFAASAIVLLLAGLGPGSAAGQSVLDRPPNTTGTWSGVAGTLYFNFIHRFTDTGAPTRKVVNYPTFLIGAGLPADILVGARYGTNSDLVPGIPNEWEFFGRIAPVAEAKGHPLDLSLHAGYNHAAESADGELSVGRRIGDLRLLASVRAFSDAFAMDETRAAWSAGATWRVHRWVALAGDYARLFDLDEDEGQGAWSAGVQLQVPYTPHTLSLHASNATTNTLQGSSIGVSETRWGFEFTVPITLSRYFGRGGDGEEADPAATEDVAAEIGMTNQLRFSADTVRIRVGQAVRWRNTSDLLHTVTADPDRAVRDSSVSLPAGASTFDSGNLEPGAVFVHTFTVPGTYTYFCVPHEVAGMVGTVVVEEGP